MDTKSLTKRLAIALAVAGGLTLATMARAQDTYYFLNFDPSWSTSSLYPNWSDYPGNPSEVKFQSYFGDTVASSGLEVISTIGGYGSGYANLNNGTGVTFNNGDLALATNDTICILSFTVNPTPGMASSGPTFYENYNWIGLVFILNLDSGIYTLANNPPGNNYSGWNNPGDPANYQWSGSNVTVTFNLSSESKFLTYTEGATNHFYGCNLGIDPAVILNEPRASGGLPYDITFNSITFTAPPTTPPNPSIRTVGPNVVISWPDPNNIFTLYQSANMAKFSWAPWGFPPVYSNGTNTVTIPPPFNHALYFRLANTTLQ